jgi:hypothetical protein
MTATQNASPSAGWRRLAVPVLALLVIGLPVNSMAAYALLVVVAVFAFTGEVSGRAQAWLAALAIVAVAVGAQWLLSPPRIDEGHNVFLPGPALQRALPAPVYDALAREFAALYPQCAGQQDRCQKTGHPDRGYAFSADGIFHESDASRAVTAIDFADPVWLRLGFVNDNRYNWYSDGGALRRVSRDSRFWMGFDRWQLLMPWYEMIRLPAGYVGGELCWRGAVMWEEADDSFITLRGNHCRTIAPADAGRRIFGIAVRPDGLAMQLTPPLRVSLQRGAQAALILAAAFALLVLLVRVRRGPALFAFMLTGLAVLVIAIDDASFLGGMRPFDGGDDGLFYDGVGRMILQKLLAGDVAGFLQGGEDVFYYGGPGLRYFRALEHIVFGETYLGYLALVLLFPFLVYGLLRRFLPRDWSLALVIVFVAVPVGVIFGTSFVQYAKWAARGFADPAAYILFAAGILPVIGTTAAGPNNKFLPGFFGALLLALGICMKPIVAPAAAVLLGGAGFYALSCRHWPRLAGLCIGFLPVFSMALHNWVYGGVFVLFSANAGNADLLVMPPAAWARTLYDLFTLNVAGDGVTRAVMQMAHWLSGPAESFATIPLNVAAVAILIYVVVRGRAFDPWLRLLGAAALAQHAVALFFNAAIARYHFLTWLLTALVAAVFFHRIAIGWLARRWPQAAARVASHPVAMRLASALARLQKVTS